MKNLRKIIRESIKEVVEESMNMVVTDHGYEDDLDNILDISHYIIKKVAYDLWPKLGLTPEQEETIGGITSDFTPDGNHAFDETMHLTKLAPSTSMLEAGLFQRWKKPWGTSSTFLARKTLSLEI